MNDHELAIYLAREAGKYLLKIRSENIVSAGDEVAAKELAKIGDSKSNDWLLEQLKIHRPEDAVLSEEAADADTRLSATRVWIIDPVDGTYEYARSLPEFAVHIALWDSAAQEFIAGAVSIPNHDLVYATSDTPIDVDIKVANRPLMIIASPREPIEMVEKLRSGLLPFALENGYSDIQVMNCGSVGGKVYQILTEKADVYVSSVGFFEWDSAAPTAIGLHHGLQVTKLDGEKLTFNHMPPRTPSFLAARPWLHAAAVAALTA
jgi:3'(2'), 5'-bisphosphate nucleotidase